MVDPELTFNGHYALLHYNITQMYFGAYHCNFNEMKIDPYRTISTKNVPRSNISPSRTDVPGGLITNVPTHSSFSSSGGGVKAWLRQTTPGEQK